MVCLMLRFCSPTPTVLIPGLPKFKWGRLLTKGSSLWYKKAAYMALFDHGFERQPEVIERICLAAERFEGSALLDVPNNKLRS